MKNIDIRKMSKQINIKEEDIEEALNIKPSKTLERVIVELRIKYYEVDTEEKRNKIAQEWDKSCLEQIKQVMRPYDAMTTYFNTRPNSIARKMVAKRWVELCNNFIETRQAVIYLKEIKERDDAFEKLLNFSNNLETLREVINLTTYRKKWYQNTIKKMASFFET